MNDYMNRSNELFDYIHPKLRTSFLKLCANGRIGLLPISAENISLIPTKLIDSRYGYNFKIQVPYARKSLGWEILFDPEDLELAPDFDFNSETFPPTLHVNEIIKEIPTLANWNLEESTSLETILKEFLQYFKKYQIKELQSNNVFSRIADEYELLMAVKEISSDDIELMIDNNSVQFLISIRVDLSKIPEYIPVIEDDGSLLNPKEDFALLFMNFHKLDASRVTVQLEISARLEQIVGNCRTLHIPNYKKDEASLVEYIPLISKMLQKRVDRVAYQCQFRKEFITSLVALRRHSITEYDLTHFNKIAFLCEVEDFMVLVQVTVRDEFPIEKPVMKICSLYCQNQNTKIPCEKTCDLKNMTTNQTADEMAKSLLLQLKKFILEFKYHGHMM